MDSKKGKDFGSIDDIRQRVLKIAREHPLTLKDLALDIQISFATLKAFLLGASVEFRTRLKLENYLNRKEQ